MLCPIFRMVFSQKHGPSSVWYIWQSEMVPVVSDPYFWLCESNLIEHKSSGGVCPPSRHLKSPGKEPLSSYHLYHCCEAGVSPLVYQLFWAVVIFWHLLHFSLLWFLLTVPVSSTTPVLILGIAVHSSIILPIHQALHSDPNNLVIP